GNWRRAGSWSPGCATPGSSSTSTMTSWPTVRMTVATPAVRGPTRMDLALFHSRVRDEIVTGPNQVFTGRSTYTNAGRSTRRGAAGWQDWVCSISGAEAPGAAQARYLP